METLRFRAMNTDILLAAEGRTALLARGFAEAREFISKSERRFSRFLDDSELTQLNNSAGRGFRASPDLFTVIVLSQDLCAKTAGLFDPAILPDLLRAGYDRSMDLIRMEGAGDGASAPLQRGGSILDVQTEPQDRLVCLPAGMMLDLGGIAKGWIAEQAASILAAYTSACAVNAGGDMFLIGLPEGEASWPVALEDPREPGEVLADLRVGPGAVATSSVTKRTWKQGEDRRHHLIDPRTGRPSESDWSSVTVLASGAAAAEVYAKALLIAGSPGAESLARNAGGISYLAVDPDGKIWGTPESLEHVHE